jgi:hypothetical protein
MRNIKKAILCIAVMILALCMLCSCAADRSGDIESIRNIPGVFLEAVTEMDEDALEEYSPGFKVTDWRDFTDNRIEVFRYYMQFAEILEMEEPVFFDDEGAATMATTISYLPMDGFLRSLDVRYMTLDELKDALDDYDKRKEKTLDLEFEYDELDDKWYLTKTSARKIYRLFTTNSTAALLIVDISAEEAGDIFLDYLRSIADCPNAASMPENINLQDYRFFDDSLNVGTGTKTNDALARFVSAYVGYVLDHDPVIRSDMSYSVEVDGSAPSAEELMSALTTEEYYVQYYANCLRYSDLGMDIDEMLDEQTALIYNTLAKAIPQCSPQNYYLYGSVSPYKDSTNICWLYGDLLSIPTHIDIDEEFTEEQYYQYTFAAIDLLYNNGELTDEQYEEMLETVISVDSAFITDTSVSSSGHVNQAVDTYEYIPSWEDTEDPVLVYGESYEDENGFSMFYSKSPGWLGTVGYCIDDDGIWIANYYSRLFYPGNDLIVDWWLDGEQIVDTQIITISEMTNEIEVFLPVDELPRHCRYEMRLWESDHSHVIAYVILTR